MPSGSEASRRVAVVGIDGFSPVWIERFLAEGSMPNLERVRAAGATVPLLSTIPATTPVAWASVATGCHPSSTGIEGFLLHFPGNALDRRVSGAYSTRCRREPLWETATLWGKRAFVVKFPLSYPSSGATLRIDGAAGWGGILCLHQACASGVAETDLPGASRFVASPSAPAMSDEALWSGALEIDTLWGGPPLAIACEVGEDLSLRLWPSTDGAEGVRLVAGQWSPMLEVRAHGRTGEESCAVRFKLLALDHQGSNVQVRLFHGPVHALDGHSHPAGVAEAHLVRAGPVEEETEPSLLLNGLIDFDTHLERCRFNSDWLQRLSASILEHEEWDLLMVHIHIVDWAHHLLEGEVDPRHPLHRPEQQAVAVDRLRSHYRAADDLVGAVATRLSAGDNIVVLGDHGQDLTHTTVRLNEAFAREGWLRWAGDGDQVAWSGTKVYAAGNYVYLNLRAREPEGIVGTDEAEALAARLCVFLRGLRDPRSGEWPVLIAAPKSRFAQLGGDGEGTGDIIFCLKSGYQARNDRGPVFALTEPGREFTSGHDHFDPRDSRIESRLYAAGDAFMPGSRTTRRSVVDVNPTLCAALGIEPTAECEGRPIVEILTPQVRSDWTAPESPEVIPCL